MNRVEKATFAVIATPVVFAASARVARLRRRLGLGPLVTEIRSAGRRPLPRWLARPLWLAGTVEQWLPVLPPYGYGPCLKRALILLDLWSRCGLTPTLHLGFRARSLEPGGHAWISAEGADGVLFRASGPNGTQPVFDL